jgi:hypothetical protein
MAAVRMAAVMMAEVRMAAVRMAAVRMAAVMMAAAGGGSALNYKPYRTLHSSYLCVGLVELPISRVCS